MQDLYRIQSNTIRKTTGQPNPSQTTRALRVVPSALRCDRSPPNLAMLDQSREQLASVPASHPGSARPSTHQADGFSLKIFVKYLYECALVDFKRYCQAFKLARSWLVVTLNPSKPALARHSEIASQYEWLNTGAYTRIMKKTEGSSNKIVANDHSNSLR